MPNICEVFADNIRELRRKHSITQKALADKLGCTEKAVSKWERGMSLPSIEILLMVAKIFRVNVESLFHDTKAVYFLGISAGEKTTTLVLADRNCAVIRRVQAQGISPNSDDVKLHEDILRNAIYKVCGDVDFSSVVTYVGISNMTSDIQYTQFNDFFKSFGFKHSNSEPSPKCYFSAALGEDDGILLVMGAGAGAHCMINGEYSSAGGRGYLLANDGGMYNIGRDGINAYFSECDGIGEKTLISEEIRKDFGDGVLRIYEDVYYKTRLNIEKFAEYVYSAAEKGDKVAINIIKKNMRETVKFVEVFEGNFVGRKIPLVMVASGMGKEGRLDYLRNELKNPDKYEISIFKNEPAMGAVLLAKKEYEKLFPEEN